MDVGTARDLVLGLPGVEEGDHFGNPSYRALLQPATAKAKRGRIFMTLQIEKHTAVLMLNVEQQADLHAHHPLCFVPHPSKWGEKGATLVLLDAVSEKILKPAVELAWNSALPKRTGK